MIERRYHIDGSIPTDGSIWVFGSNLAGRHGKGAALVARQKFGAVYGNGVGLQGNSYAIPTKDEKIQTRPLELIKISVKQFVNITRFPFNSDVQWFVCRVGCYLAGYKDSDIAPLFKDAINCSFAEQWKPYLENTV